MTFSSNHHTFALSPHLYKTAAAMPIKTGHSRSRSIVLSEHISEDNPVRVIDDLVDALNLAALGFLQIVTYLLKNKNRKTR